MARVNRNIQGHRYSKLKVLRYVGDGKWLCQCDCGNQSTPSVNALQCGKARSCGCWLDAARTKHGMHKTRVYRVWVAMRVRCNNPKDPSFHNYGGRGIAVCERWNSFSNFIADMGDRPSGYDIDRIDNNSDYCPENCRWVTRRENLRNTRQTRMLTHNGETLSMREWGERYGIAHTTLKYRIDTGMPVEQALTSKPYKAGRRSAAQNAKEPRKSE